MPNEFTKIAARYTGAYSFGVGLLLAALLLAVFRTNLIVSLVAGLLFGVANWIVWRPGGIGRRIQKDIPEGPVSMKPIIQLIVIGTAIFLLVFGGILLARSLST